jgi:hypothetical protein
LLVRGCPATAVQESTAALRDRIFRILDAGDSTTVS